MCNLLFVAPCYQHTASLLSYEGGRNCFPPRLYLEYLKLPLGCMQHSKNWTELIGFIILPQKLLLCVPLHNLFREENKPGSSMIMIQSKLLLTKNYFTHILIFSFSFVDQTLTFFILCHLMFQLCLALLQNYLLVFWLLLLLLLDECITSCF